MRFWNTRPQVDGVIELRSELIRQPTDPKQRFKNYFLQNWLAT